MTIRPILIKRGTSLQLLILTCFVLLLSGGEFSTSAATRTWTGNGLPAVWSDPSNWGGAVPTAGDDLVFPESAQALNRIIVHNFLLDAASYNSITFSGGGYSITSAAALQTSSGITASNADGTNTLSFLLGLAGPQTVTVNAGATLALAGGLNLGAHTLTLAGDGTLVVPLGIMGTTGGLVINGNGTRTLSGVSNFQGPITVNSGTLVVGGASALGDVGAGTTVNSGATLKIDGGGTGVILAELLTLSGAGAGGSGALVSANGANVLTGGVTVSAAVSVCVEAAAQLELSGVLSGSATLSKICGGTLKLSANNTLTGQTLLAEGSLMVNGNHAAGTISVSGGVLGGTGTVGAVVSSGGLVSPGEGAGGTLHVAGNLEINSGAKLSVDLNGAAPGSGHDQLDVTGTVSLGGSLDLSLGFTPGAGDAFVIINNDGTDAVVGVFLGLPEGATVTVNGIVLQITYAGGAGGNDVVLTRVLPTTTALSASTNPVVSGQPLTLTATVSSALPAGGTVTFKDGATVLGTGTLGAGGQATLTTSNLDVGPHSLTASYGGDQLHLQSSSSAQTMTVNQADTATELRASVNPSVSGQPLVFTATVSVAAPGGGTPTGTVTFKDGAAVLGTAALGAGGQASLTTSALPPDSHSITASYGGDARYAASPASAPLPVTVNQAGTGVALNVSTASAVAGQSVTLTAAVSVTAPGSGAPTGTVTFRDGAANLGAVAVDAVGHATFTSSTLGQGSHTLTAEYSGDDSFTGATAVGVNITVGRAATSVAVSPSAASPVSGQSVTYTATVTVDAPGSGTPTGTVTFRDGATTLGTANVGAAGQAVFSSALAAGAHSITASFDGDNQFTAGVSPPLNVSVTQALTNVTLNAASGTAVVGEPIALSATVGVAAPGGGTPTGIVTFKDGAAVLGTGVLGAGGQATLTTSVLSPGSHSITAVYEGDANYTASAASTPLSVTVNQAGTSASLSASTSTPVAGQSVTLTMVVNVVAPGSGAPTGTVTFRDGAAVLGTSTLGAGGQATLTTLALAQGAHTITAEYGGDISFGGSAAPGVSLSVGQAATSVVVSPSVASPVSGQPVTYTATVTVDSPGSGLPTGTVTFRDGTQTLGTANLGAAGQATLTSPLATGLHSITASYEGAEPFTPSTSSPLNVSVAQAQTVVTLNASGGAALPGQPITLTATVGVNAPGGGTPTGAVTFMDGGTPLGSATLSGGQAALTVSTLSQGAHSITAVYGGDPDFSGESSAVLTVTVIAESSQSTVEFSAASYTTPETDTAVTVTVVRAGDASQPMTVEYETQDGTASERQDYTTAVGRLRFGAGEASKTFTVLVNNDSFAEGEETAQLILSNPTGGATLGARDRAALVIQANAPAASANLNDESAEFVRQHYHDFLNRVADDGGLQFWAGGIEQCGGDLRCREVRRVNASAAFFLSIEFQQTGYLVHRLYKVSFARMPRYRELIRGTRQIGEGVVVLGPGWEAKLEGNKGDFVDEWAAGADFRALYDGMSNQQFVEALYANAGVVPEAVALSQLVNDLNDGAVTRAGALRRVAEDPAFQRGEFNRAFVLMQYFGYLRRNPDDFPDSDFSGWQFWLSKLEEFNGNYINAEMVKAFLISIEYRNRFGQ